MARKIRVNLRLSAVNKVTPAHGDFFRICLTAKDFVRIILNKIEHRTQNTEDRIQNKKVKGGDLVIDYLLLSNDY
jgi:hypothetical protein